MKYWQAKREGGCCINLPPCHPRESGDPAIANRAAQSAALDSRFRGNDRLLWYVQILPPLRIGLAKRVLYTKQKA
jgi:hypothetical protein